MDRESMAIATIGRASPPVVSARSERRLGVPHPAFAQLDQPFLDGVIGVDDVEKLVALNGDDGAIGDGKRLIRFRECDFDPGKHAFGK